jgi:hypothetical protein
MRERLWERAKPMLAGCVMWALLVEGVGSWRAGHWLNADEWVAAEDSAVANFGTGVCRAVLLPFGGTAGDCEVRP